MGHKEQVGKPGAHMASAIMTYSTAKGFNEAAKMIYTSPHYGPDRSDMLVLPFGHLIGFAIELYLKAYLLHHGVTEATLRSREYGHKLAELYALAQAHGFSEAHVMLIHDYEEPHRNFEYRYADESNTYVVPDYVRVFAAMDALDTYVDGVIGASASHGLTPGH